MTTISRKKFSNSKLYQRFTIVQRIVTPEISLKKLFSAFKSNMCGEGT